MSVSKRTDLAVEARDLYNEAARKSGDPDGIQSIRREKNGLSIHTVKVLNADGAQRIGRPVGKYVTIDITDLIRKEENAFLRTIHTVAAELRALLPADLSAPVMVIGLGNREVTPDSLGPRAAEKVIATRHLLSGMPARFHMLRPVTVLTPGVLGMTGIESGEIVCGVTDKVPPAALIVIDALAACRSERLCRTIQIADTGITPGSGVGNSRFALTKETIGVPCIAIGVPTVIDAATLIADVLDGMEFDYSPEDLHAAHGDNFVTNKEIDIQIAECAKAIAYGINLAVQSELTVDDIDLFLA